MQSGGGFDMDRVRFLVNYKRSKCVWDMKRIPSSKFSLPLCASATLR